MRRKMDEAHIATAQPEDLESRIAEYWGSDFELSWDYGSNTEWLYFIPNGNTVAVIDSDLDLWLTAVSGPKDAVDCAEKSLGFSQAEEFKLSDGFDNFWDAFYKDPKTYMDAWVKAGLSKKALDTWAEGNGVYDEVPEVAGKAIPAGAMKEAARSILDGKDIRKVVESYSAR